MKEYVTGRKQKCNAGVSRVHVVHPETDDLLAVGNNHSERVGDMFKVICKESCA